MGTSRRKRSSNEATFLEQVKSQLNEMKADLAYIRLKVDEVAVTQALSAAASCSFYSAPWDAWDAWSALDFAPPAMEPQHDKLLSTPQVQTSGTTEVMDRELLLMYSTMKTKGDPPAELASLKLRAPVNQKPHADECEPMLWKTRRKTFIREHTVTHLELQDEAARIIQGFWKTRMCELAETDTTDHSDSDDCPNDSKVDTLDISKHNAMTDPYAASHENITDRIADEEEEEEREGGTVSASSDGDDEQELLLEKWRMDMLHGVDGNILKLKNLPDDYDTYVVRSLLAEKGFAESTEFIYFPRSDRDRGVAFVKLDTTDAAESLLETLDGFEAWSQIAHKTIQAVESCWEEIDIIERYFGSDSADSD